MRLRASAAWMLPQSLQGLYLRRLAEVSAHKVSLRLLIAIKSKASSWFLKQVQDDGSNTSQEAIINNEGTSHHIDNAISLHLKATTLW